MRIQKKAASRHRARCRCSRRGSRLLAPAAATINLMFFVGGNRERSGGAAGRMRGRQRCMDAALDADRHQSRQRSVVQLCSADGGDGRCPRPRQRSARGLAKLRPDVGGRTYRSVRHHTVSAGAHAWFRPRGAARVRRVDPERRLGGGRRRSGAALRGRSWTKPSCCWAPTAVR